MKRGDYVVFETDSETWTAIVHSRSKEQPDEVNLKDPITRRVMMESFYDGYGGCLRMATPAEIAAVTK